jgi:LacI family transcriptional regulator
MPSVSEIARRAGVSKSTVSLVLNNRPNVSNTTRRRVIQALEDLQRAAAASSIKVEQRINVLLIHPILLGSQQVFRELLQGVKNGIEESDGRLTLAVHQPLLQPAHATHALLHDRAFRPDGVIVMGARVDDPILDEVRRESLPCVLLARQEAPPDMSAVGMDNVAGAREATEYLITLGHRRIAFVGGDASYDYTNLRRAGYCAALQAAQLPTDGLTFLGTGDEAARTFLNARTGATAIFFVNDEQALRALPVIARAGLRIPDDLSVICFDDTDQVLRYKPPLTAVAVPRTQVGYWTAKTLLDCIHHRELKTVRVVLRTSLSVRASCQAPKE